MPDDVPPFPPPPTPPHQPVVTRSFFEGLAMRGKRRAEPRVGVGLAGAAAAMGVVGVVAVGGDQLAGTGGGESSQVPGLLMTLGVIVIGVVLTATYRRGPLAAGGVAASAIAVVPFFVFATYSKGSTTPFATILFLSSVAWALAYVVGPGRGHNLYLAGFLFGVWLWFIEATEHVFSNPLIGVFNVTTSGRFGSPPTPDATTIGADTIAFALAYLALAWWLDRRGQPGNATPLMAAGIVTLVAGIGLLADFLHQVGTGAAFAIAGAGLLYVGATTGRRATNWIGAALVFVGVTTIVDDPFSTATAFGFAEIAVGALLVFGAHLVASTFNEPDETEPVPSRFYRAGSVQPSGPPPPPAGSVLG